MDKEITEIIVSLLIGGGLASIITVFIEKKKAKSDIANSNIEMAMKLRDEATKEYCSISDKLKVARELLDEVQHQLEVAKDYIDTLCDILDIYKIEYPPKPREVFNEPKEVEDGNNGKTAEN